MRLPVTLSFYIGRQFLMGVAIVFLVISSLILLTDTLETIRRSYGKEVPFGIILEMVLLKWPYLVHQLMPFAVMLGGIFTFSKLTRTCELIVARAAGVSAWQFLMPAIMASFIMGVVLVTVFNPFSAAMLTRFEQIESKYVHGNDSMLAVSSSGVWLREKNKDAGTSIIHALHVNQSNLQLYDVTLFTFTPEYKLVSRIDAEEAAIADKQWWFKHAMLTAPGKLAQQYETYALPTNLVISQLQDSFASPEAISFWELPSFIRTLKAAGFSALRHSLHWHSLLVTPFLLCAMVFIAAVFSLRPPRKGRTGLLMSSGIFVGFVIYFTSDLVAALGLSGSIPIILAAWAPVAISILTGMGLMLHLEDG